MAKSVTLIDRNGAEIQVSTPADVNNLVFGAGYKVKGNKTVDQALAEVLDQTVEPEAPVAAQTTTTKTAK